LIGDFAIDANCMANLNRLFAAELSSGLIVAPQVDEGTLLAHHCHVRRAEKRG
jgi:hypothetical protein